MDDYTLTDLEERLEGLEGIEYSNTEHVIDAKELINKVIGQDDVPAAVTLVDGAHHATEDMASK